MLTELWKISMLHNLYGSWAKKLRHVHHKTIRKVQNFLIFSLKKGLSELTCGAIFVFEDAVFSFRPWQIICGCSKPYLHTELLLHITFANMSRQIVGVWPIIVWVFIFSVVESPARVPKTSVWTSWFCHRKSIFAQWPS